MSIGMFRPVTMDLSVETAEGRRTWEGLTYADFPDADVPPAHKRVFVAVGSVSDPEMPGWAQELLGAGNATVKLIGYPRQSWQATARLASDEERRAAWVDIKQARPTLNARRDQPNIGIIVLDLKPSGA
jgi:hypothetical protein